MKEEAEIMRIGYKYRKILRTGRIALPYKDAVKIIGPDCAYHLYHAGDEIMKKNTPDNT